MPSHYSILVLAVAALIGLIAELRFQRRLRRFNDLPCTGRDWRRRFPDVAKSDIRQFLDTFVDAFSINQASRLNFSPDKQVMEVYRELYPPGSAMDCFELETFEMNLEDRYDIDVNSLQHDNITLGDIFEQVVSHRRPQN
jgi:propanediol dehydratase small subunit